MQGHDDPGARTPRTAKERVDALFRDGIKDHIGTNGTPLDAT